MFKQRFNKEKSKENLKRLVGTTIFMRGVDYYEDGAVGQIKIASSKSADIKISAPVLGSDEYLSHAIFDLRGGSFDGVRCDCPYDRGECKHGAALGLKFLDIYADFCHSNAGEVGMMDYKRSLVRWFKNSQKNEVQDWEGEHYEDEDNAEEYEDGDGVVNIASAQGGPVFGREDDAKREIESNRMAILSLRERLKSIGIDAEKIPKFIINELEKKVSGGDIKIGAPAKSEKSAMAEELGERLLRKYCLVLRTDYSLKIEIHEKNKPDASYWEVRPEQLLNREKNNLTPKQKELLAFLRDAKARYYENYNTDLETLFNLIKDSELAIFLNRKMPKNRLSFNENPQKIGAQLYCKNDEFYLGSEPAEQLEIFFKLKGQLLEKKNIKIYPGVDALVVLDDFQLNIFPMSKILFGIVSRTLQYHNYRYDGSLGTSLQETILADFEIIKINEIILGAEQAFALENDLSEKFTINKFKKVGPVIVVDYDSAGSNLQLRAAMNYGFMEIDVAHIAHKSMRGGRTSFQKRYLNGREKYHLEIKVDEINYAEICEEDEIDLFEKFSEDEKYGFSKTVRCVKKGVKQIGHFQDNCWPKIKALGYPIEYLRDDFDFSEEDFKADFKVDFNDANDWFEFDVNCYCGENKITLADLRRYVENKEQFIKMADGRIAKITNRAELEKFVAMLESFYQKEGQKFEAKIYHAPELDNIMSGSQYYESKISKSFRKFMDEAQSGKPVEKVKIPEKIKKPLRDYQKEGIDWFYFLRKYHFGGILADDMGLGKTLQALSLVEMNKIAGKPSLVICPKTLLFNWEDEAVKFFPKMKTLVIDGFPLERQQKLAGADKYDLVITSYPAVKKDEQHYEKLKFNYCFIDEAQYIKNHKTQNARSVKKIHADYRLALTGTPLENSVSEIWSFFDYLMPGFLGSHSSFNERFEKPIMKYADKDALDALRKKISCFMLRRTKEKVLKELPPKIEQLSHCQLGSEQNILYQEILSNVKSQIFETVEKKGFANSQIHILAGLTKLRQVCNHPVLLLKDKDHEKYSSAKLELFLELIDEIISSGKKVLVFSQFTQMLDILAKEFKKQNIAYHYLSGKTKNRKELVSDFNSNEKIPVFLISLKAGGTGLNLVSADNVIIFDPWWNPSVENQAVDRAHRIGQKNSVNVYRLIAKGTIEEKIVQLQEKKKFLFDNMVGESNDLFKKLTWSEVKELFE